jgi:phosphoribosylglycinamide formyltransferase 2
MQVSDVSEVLSLRDDTALRGVIRTHRPDLIMPEAEAVSVDTLKDLESDGYRVAPSAAVAQLALDRAALRAAARDELGLRTPAHRFASSRDELRIACDEVGYPCVVKPIAGYAGKGQSVVAGPARIDRAWAFAHEEAVDESYGVMVEEFVQFRNEVTLPTIREWDGTTTHLPPIGQRRERGGFRESWIPAELDQAVIVEMHDHAAKVATRLGGAGLFGVEFFITDEEVIFSEVSVGPDDAGMVTTVSHDLSQFDLHLRATIGLPIPGIRFHGPGASAAILADRDGEVRGYRGLRRALQVETAQIRIFGKSEAHMRRPMGVALASGPTVAESRGRALEAASRVSLEYA